MLVNGRRPHFGHKYSIKVVPNTEKGTGQGNTGIEKLIGQLKWIDF